VASRSKLKDSILVEQYKRCAEDWRHHDRLLWQIPFSTATVVSAVIAVSYGYFGEGISYIPTEVKIPLFAFMILFVITMGSVSRKVRFFQEIRTEFAYYIEENGAKIKELPVDTSSSLEFLQERCKKKRFVRYRAIHLQYLLYLYLTGALVYLLYYEGGQLGIIVIIGTLFCVSIALLWDKLSSIIIN